MGALAREVCVYFYTFKWEWFIHDSSDATLAGTSSYTH